MWQFANRTALSTVFRKTFLKFGSEGNFSSKHEISISKPLSILPGTCRVIRWNRVIRWDTEQVPYPMALYCYGAELNWTELNAGDFRNRLAYQQVFILPLQLVDGSFLALEGDKQQVMISFPLWFCRETAAPLNLLFVRHWFYTLCEKDFFPWEIFHSQRSFPHWSEGKPSMAWQCHLHRWRPDHCHLQTRLLQNCESLKIWFQTP